MDERDYRRGPGRALQRDKRNIAAGEAVFRAGFLSSVLPIRNECRHCDAGTTIIKLRRQRVHVVDRRIFVCTKD